jgi:hypothetical protein
VLLDEIPEPLELGLADVDALCHGFSPLLRGCGTVLPRRARENAGWARTVPAPKSGEDEGGRANATRGRGADGWLASAPIRCYRVEARPPRQAVSRTCASVRSDADGRRRGVGLECWANTAILI